MGWRGADGPADAVRAEAAVVVATTFREADGGAEVAAVGADVGVVVGEPWASSQARVQRPMPGACGAQARSGAHMVSSTQTSPTRPASARDIAALSTAPPALRLLHSGAVSIGSSGGTMRSAPKRSAAMCRDNAAAGDVLRSAATRANAGLATTAVGTCTTPRTATL